MWLKTLYRKRAVTWPFIFYTIIWTLSKGYPDKILKQIGYYMPEERIEKEFCEVLFDSEQLLVLLTQNKLICQFENN
ncbi:hypothetical protein [Enterococcus faecium]|uniref:hypothetical protein n=1 Tax=Enterococcus faecium TaxID=1352 RepID=UPI0021B0E54B|nr:hypothetical protein [Enterococcus faecium]